MENQTELSKAIDVLCEALRTDKDYWDGWKANIAMAVYDEYTEDARSTEADSMHTICNRGADRFLKLLTYKPKEEITE